MIRMNESRSIIEAYYDGGDSYIGHHKFSCIMQYEGENVAVKQTWESAELTIESQSKGSINRKINSCDLHSYRYAIMKMACPENVKVQVFFDGVRVMEVWGTGSMEDYVCSMNRQSVEHIRYLIENGTDRDVTLRLYYVGAAKTADAPEPLYAGDWEGCFERVVSWEPFNADVMTAEELGAVRQKIQRSPYREIYAGMKDSAEGYLQYEPEKYIGKVINEGYRKRMHFCKEMEVLAFVGIVEQREDMIRLACRCALSLCACTSWGCDIMEDVPVCVWHHRSFNESSACGAAAFVLSLCGASLTWHGRNIIYQSLIMKGLPRIEADLMTMEYIYHMNQGIAFLSGYVKALVCLCHEYPRYERRLSEAEDILGEMVQRNQNADGSTDEGAGYWQYTFLNLFQAAIPICRRKGIGLKEYLQQALQKTSDYGLALMDTYGKMLPVNDCSRNFYIPFVSNCFYQMNQEVGWAVAYHSADDNSFDAYELIYGVEIPDGPGFERKEAEEFRDAGMLFVNRNNIRFIGVSGKSNATHCHEDKGSFLLYRGGELLLADRGILSYGDADGEICRRTAYHNAAVPVTEEGKEMTQLCGAGLSADYAYTLKDGVLKWSSDQSALWDSEIVLKNTREIYSETAEEYIIIDVFVFTKPMSCRVCYQVTSENVLVEQITPCERTEGTDNIMVGREQVTRICFTSEKAEHVIMKTKVRIRENGEDK